MASVDGDILKLSFKFVCIFATVFMIGFWIAKFRKNDDVSVVEYKEFEEFEGSIYPEVTICIVNPFLADKLKEIDSNASVHEYV